MPTDRGFLPRARLRHLCDSGLVDDGEVESSKLLAPLVQRLDVACLCQSRTFHRDCVELMPGPDVPTT
eukprot:3902269-Rhodomonas_salina.1